jgi:hypothetical protein
MNVDSLILELYCRKRLDRDAAWAALAFLLDYGKGAIQPEECGVYDPYEPFHRINLRRYADWLAAPGGEFGFRGKAASFAVEGHVLNLLFAPVMTEAEGSQDIPLPTVEPPVLSSRWRFRFEPLPQDSEDVDFVKEFFMAAARATGADYGFVAHSADFKAKHFSSVSEGSSVVEQYLGEDPEHGIPGLYWLNLFGNIYRNFFGDDRMAGVAGLMKMPTLPDGDFLLQFGQRPEDSLTEDVTQKQQLTILALGESAFFDIHKLDRILSVPQELSRSLGTGQHG